MRLTCLAKLITVTFVCLLSSFSLSANSHDYYSSFLGGDNQDKIYDIVTDQNGDVYITGSTFSIDFDPPSPDKDATRNQDVFVAKLSNNGTQLDFVQFLRGASSDTGRAIAIDSQYIYITGETNSTDFLQQEMGGMKISGTWDSFLVRLDKESGEINFARFIGGNGVDFGHGIALGNNQTVIVVGETWSSDFTTSANAFLSRQGCIDANVCDQSDDTSGRSNGFILQYSIQNDNIEYASYIGGNRDDKAHSVTFYDDLIYIVGETNSADFSTLNFIETNARLNRNSGSEKYDGFIAVYDPRQFNSTDSLVFASFLGGSGDDFAQDVDIDAKGDIYITGSTHSTDLPIQDNSFDRFCGTNAVPCNADRSDAFVIKLTKSDSYHLCYSTYIGGQNNELSFSIAVTDEGDFAITGHTNSNDFPFTDNARNGRCEGLTPCEFQDDDAFISVFSDLGQGFPELMYSTFLRGKLNESSRGINIDSFGNIYVGGSTNSEDFDGIQQSEITTIIDNSCGTDSFCNNNGGNNPETDAYIVRLPKPSAGQIVNLPEIPDPKPPVKQKKSGGSLSALMLILLLILVITRYLGAIYALLTRLCPRFISAHNLLVTAVLWKSIHPHTVKPKVLP